MDQNWSVRYTGTSLLRSFDLLVRLAWLCFCVNSSDHFVCRLKRFRVQGEMWRISKVFKDVTRWNSASQLSRFSPLSLRKDYSSSNAGDSDVKAGVPYTTLQVGRSQIRARFVWFICVLFQWILFWYRSERLDPNWPTFKNNNLFTKTPKRNFRKLDPFWHPSTKFSNQRSTLWSSSTILTLQLTLILTPKHNH